MRYERKDGSISIAYGFDESVFVGVFLSVFNRRLEYDENASDEVNAISEKLCIPDGGGCFLDLYTGLIGLGWRVSETTMEVYLKRYGLTNEECQELFARQRALDFGESENVDNLFTKRKNYLQTKAAAQIKLCSVCLKETSKSCTKCKSAHYCSIKCQKSDWPKHKRECIAIAKSDAMSVQKFLIDVPSRLKQLKHEKSVYGLLLNEDASKAEIVEVPLEKGWDEEEGVFSYFPNLSIFGIYETGVTSMPRNPYKEERMARNVLYFFHNERFLFDGSPVNKIADLIVKDQKCKKPSHWRGPILVMKSYSLDSLSYTDFDSSDFEDVMDFFKWYAK